MGARRDLTTMVLRLVLVTVYCILGAGVFYAIEHTGGYEQEESERKKTLYNTTKSDIMQRFGINNTEFELLVAKVVDAQSKTPFEWTFSRGLDLSWQAMTTIGYGNKPPITRGGQIFLIPFSVAGIALTVIMLNTVGENICHLISYVITKIEKNILGREEVRGLQGKSLIVNIILTIGLIIFMAGVSTHFDDWSFVEGLYVWFVTFSTIGFGDYIPGSSADDSSGIGVVMYRVIFVILGLSLLSTILNAIGNFLESRKKAPRNCLCFQRCWPKRENGTIQDGEGKEDCNNGKDNVEMQHYL